MGSWGFMALAYGLASVVLLGYFLLPKGRLRAAREEFLGPEQDLSRRPR